MRQRLSLIPALSLVILLGCAYAPGHAQYATPRALELADARYQHAARELQQARAAFDIAAARHDELSRAYEAAVNDQRAAERMLADADISGPNAAQAVHEAEAALEAERQRIAPHAAPLEAARAAHHHALEQAIAQMPEWVAAQQRFDAAQAAYDAAVEDVFARLQESEPYINLLIETWDAEDAADALRDAPPADQDKLIEATRAWMAALDALERYEDQALAADPAVEAMSAALAQEAAKRDAVRSQLAQRVFDDADVQRTAAALAEAERAFEPVAEELRRAEQTLEARRIELSRIDQIAADARQRLERAQRELPELARALAESEDAARRAEAELAAARQVEQRSLQEREAIASDLSRTTVYPPESPIYADPPIVIVDGGSSVYYPPSPPRHHHSDRHHDEDKHHDHDRNRHDDRDDRDHGGTRRDDGIGPTRGRDDGPARRDETAEPPRRLNERNPSRGDRSPGPPQRDYHPPGADDAATARRKQEEAKAAQRQRQEDQAAAAAARQRSDAARAAEARRQENEAARQRQQSESAGREQQRQQERQQRESSRSEDRGDRYRRR